MQWYTKETKELFKAILSLKTQDQAKRFFRDLLTEAEIDEFSRRWNVARLLDEGVTYVEIEKRTGMSSTTIARIAKWLNKGMGGYRHALHHVQTSRGRGVR